MKRSEFIKMCSLLGISIPFQSVIASCSSKEIEDNFTGKVLIIGAGAAGLTAGYLLAQRGIDFKIIEASNRYGGRMKTANDFADFPIPLGAEWLHVEKSILNEIVNDQSVSIDIETKMYNLNTDYGLYEGEQVSMEDIGFSIDQKFINSSWLDFYETYLLPHVTDKIIYNEAVQEINYVDDKVMISTENNQYDADKVIVTVPVKLLQSNAIHFIPELPNQQVKAIQDVTVWDGFKAFIEFSEKFYPTAVAFRIRPETAGQKLYYDASYGQNSDHHVLGLFTVGLGTLPYRNLSDAELIAYILQELDAIFDGKASSTYVKHISQNWNAEPFAQGAYVNDHENWRRVRSLGTPVNNKVFFAGTSYTDGEDWGSVHTAAQSAINVINEILT